MTYYIVKIAITTILIVAVSEISKRSSLFGGLLASLPLVSFVALIWLYVETGNTEKVAGLAQSVFLLLAYLLKRGTNFSVSLGVATLMIFGLYWGMVVVLRKYGIET